jgi:hypothetical protein
MDNEYKVYKKLLFIKTSGSQTFTIAETLRRVQRDRDKRGR